ncbi:hypothetical protein ACW9HW_26305, partial [Pseudomonas sp. SDO5532_S415]
GTALFLEELGQLWERACSRRGQYNQQGIRANLGSIIAQNPLSQIEPSSTFTSPFESQNQ